MGQRRRASGFTSSVVYLSCFLSRVGFSWLEIKAISHGLLYLRKAGSINSTLSVPVHGNVVVARELRGRRPPGRRPNAAAAGVLLLGLPSPTPTTSAILRAPT
jgi:hypothetical protein